MVCPMNRVDLTESFLARVRATLAQKEQSEMSLVGLENAIDGTKLCWEDDKQSWVWVLAKLKRCTQD